MESIDNIQQYQLYVDAEIVPGTSDLIFYDGGSVVYACPRNDFWFPVFLSRSSEVFEYVQISRDEEIVSIERQEVNPYFMELSFFDSIKKHKVLIGSDLTLSMVNFIRNSRIELSNSTNQEVVKWFDEIGVNELPWFKGTNDEITIDDIDKISIIASHTISKANYFNIDINK